uniref:Heat shock protein hsp88-like n=1 Tax=Piliocolobus tephrosceles TaxID=591936 RepID=A0A8C9LM30_9PRIM
MSVLGIDIGNENSVVATIEKGAINIVRNDLSERLTPTLVGFTEKERLIGDNALAKVKSNFKNTCRNIKNLIGKIGTNLDEDDLELNESYGDLVACEYNYLGYMVGYKNEVINISAVRVLSTLLHFLIKLAEKYVGKECTEIVLAYPPTYTNSQKECLLVATKLINIKALRFISDNTAVALDYGMYRMREFKENQGVVVAFVNIGYANSCVCIARFFTKKCEILSDYADSTLGGRNIDNEIIKYINNIFIESYKINALYKNYPTQLCEMGNGKLNKYIDINNKELSKIDNKIRVKLQDVAVKTKKILSANNETSIHVECLYEDYDCQGSINRETLENMCSNFFLSKLKNLLDKSIITSKVKIEEIQSIEILGGTTRVPFIQRFLMEYFNKPLSKTLVADESVARGCLLSAAMLSKHYKVKEYECIEKIQHPISVQWCNINEATHTPITSNNTDINNDNSTTTTTTTATTNNNSSGFIKTKVHKLYTCDSLKKKVNKIVIPEKGAIKVTAFYDENPDLPPNCVKELSSCILKVNDKHDKIVESHIMTSFSHYDTFTFLGANTVSKTVIKTKDEQKKVEEKTDNEKGTTTTTSSSGTNTDGNLKNGAEKGGEKISDKEETTDSIGGNNKTITENQTHNKNKNDLKKGEEGKVQTCYTSIPVEVLPAPGTYTAKDIYTFSEYEINMQHSDTIEAERLKHINELETIIYETRDRMNSIYSEFATEEEKNKVLVTLDNIENFIYDNMDENKNAFIKKKKKLEN